MSTQALIQKFFSQKRFAMIGVSRNEKDFSRTLFREFIKQGYEAIPVNPFATELDGKRCYARVGEIATPVTAALLMTPKSGNESLIDDCAESGISLIWLYGISGAKDVSPSAIQRCKESEIEVIAGYCPFMLLPTSSWIHRLHGSVWKMLGKYPQ